jgi:outer membrane protein
MRIVRAIAAAAVLATATAAVPALTSAAHAAELKIATADFQRALSEINEGEKARAKLEGMFASKQAAIKKMEAQLTVMQQELQAQAAILSPDAVASKQQAMQQLGAQYQQTYMASEQEMQGAYAQVMEGLIKKMRTICEEIALEKSFDLVLEKQEGGVIFSASSMDITPELIKRYNARHAG